MKKIFVVGCPRSGTTLVQELLGAHRHVYTCTETHYLQKIRRRGKTRVLRPLDYLVLSRRNVLEAYDHIRLENELLGQYDSSDVRSLRAAILFFDQLMTLEAEARGKSAWVEKTPGHLFQIRQIKRHIPSAQFVHVIRDGRDVVASLVDAADRFPRIWRKHTDLKETIRFYNRRLRESSKYCGREGHVFVQYEHILDDVERCCHKLYTSLGLESVNLNLDLLGVHRKVVRDGEGWKVDFEEVRDTRLVKFSQIFNDQQKELVRNRVKRLPQRLSEVVI